MSDTAGSVPPRQPDPVESLDTADPGPARALTLHLLRMLETRMDAAGIAFSSEIDAFIARLRLNLIAAGALFLALWAGIVLIAIALPESWRIPVLAAVVVAFALGAVWAQAVARRNEDSREIGSLRWFMEGLKRDLEVVSRTLAQRPPHVTPVDDRSPPSDLAA